VNPFSAHWSLRAVVSSIDTSSFHFAASISAVALLAVLCSAGDAQSTKLAEELPSSNAQASFLAANGARPAERTNVGIRGAPPRRPVRYPASYFWGPLGKHNPLPPRKGVFLLGWHGRIGVGWNGAKANLLERHHAMRRKFDGIATAYVPSERRERWIHKQGALPIIAGWTPEGSPREIASGERDRQIVAFAKYLKKYTFIVMVRLFHEFDLSHTSYHACGDTFIAQWRRVVDVFKQQGVTNAGFWWSPTEGANRACIESSYPGDAYVDWVGTDSYNFCYVGESSCWVTPMHSGWAEFSELFDYPPGPGYQSYHSLYGPRKPFVVGETSTVYDPNDSSKKGNWYRNIVPAAKQMEHLTGIMFFDSNVQAAEGPKANFLVDYPSSDAYAGFIEMARDPYFNTR
jgi:hypothetical protein